jgi:uncharacterized protein (DUF433 family)
MNEGREEFERLVQDMDNRFDMSPEQVVNALRYAVRQERKRRGR